MLRASNMNITTTSLVLVVLQYILASSFYVHSIHSTSQYIPILYVLRARNNIIINYYSRLEQYLVVYEIIRFLLCILLLQLVVCIEITIMHTYMCTLLPLPKQCNSYAQYTRTKYVYSMLPQYMHGCTCMYCTSSQLRGKLRERRLKL